MVCGSSATDSRNTGSKPAEDISMVEDVALNKAILHLAEVSDQIFFADVKAGYAHSQNQRAQY